jgi:hypothetical protein
LSFLKVANIDYLLRLQVTYLSLKLWCQSIYFEKNWLLDQVHSNLYYDKIRIFYKCKLPFYKHWLMKNFTWILTTRHSLRTDFSLLTIHFTPNMPFPPLEHHKVR